MAKFMKIGNTHVRNRSEEEDEDDIEGVTSYTISQNQHVWSEYIVRMHNPIGNASKYATLFNLLDSASEDDEIKLDLSSPGGSLDSCILIRRAIQQCSAQVTVRIGPTCASAAGAIALACDSWEIDEMSTMMVHTGSFAPGFGKVNDIHAASSHNLQQIERFVRDTYQDFLTEDEIEAVLNGKEMYLRSDDLGSRLSRVLDAREAATRFEEEGYVLQEDNSMWPSLEERLDMED